MTHLTISRDIRPISDLKAKGSEIVTQVANTGRPVVLTRHGRGVAVVLAVDEYEPQLVFGEEEPACFSV